MGYLCTYVPEEIIHAAGLTPIRILPCSAPAARADAHLQSYTCSLARSCLDQALAGKLDFLAGVTFAHTCDTLQGLADIWHEAFPERYVDTVVNPVALHSPHARPYLVAELRRFAQSLEERFKVQISDEALSASIRLYNARRKAMKQFYARREYFSALEWFGVMNTALVTPPEQFSVPVVPSTPPAAHTDDQIRLALVGSTIDEPTLPQILDELGARIVADDFCNGARYFDTLVPEAGDPYEALAQRMMTRAVCPCKHRGLDERADRLLTIVHESRAQGVIFYLKKFCDPHAWDYVPLAAALDHAGIPHLLLETEQAAPVGQTRVRVEAFLEMLNGI
jgi:benzoyl-CoA reductase/2-hydroxyglutaryl-CoA dehydratase subunit BcrC/BadD/HgdB